MMDFDEYDYLEKTVEEQEKEDASEAEGMKRDKETDKSERGYRKRDGKDNLEILSGDEERKRSKRSRGEDSNGDRKDRDRRRSSRDDDRETRRDKDRERERSRVEKESERGRLGSHESERSRERDRDRDIGRSRDKDGERDKEREREREKRDKERERERRDREKERERELEEREKGRSQRSSSRSRRHEDREREQSRGRDLEIEGRDGRRFKDKKDAEPEADPERDQRTVFAYQMPLKANEKDVYEFFSKAGKVRDVRLIMDRNSRRSKGVGYIEFYDAMSVPMAIALSGQLLMGQPVMVKPSEAEKNLVQSTASTGGSSGLVGPYGPVDRKLYVGNLHFNMTELQLRQIFEPFGTIELVQLPLDLETGHCKGFGFVQFAQVEHAKAAQSLNGKLEIAGRVIKVSSVSDHVGAQDTSAKSADFDDDDGGGLALNAHSRALLMQKLDRSGIATSITGNMGIPAINGASLAQPALPLHIGGQLGVPMQVLAPSLAEATGNPSECLVMKNMFDPATETDPDFDRDIKDDVEEECSNFGRVKHIFVDKNSAGYVYIRFDTIEAAMKAQRAMHMRWFARRLVSALFMPVHEYDAKFKSGA